MCLGFLGPEGLYGPDLRSAKHGNRYQHQRQHQLGVGILLAGWQSRYIHSFQHTNIESSLC
jgi:hypothetical protein